MAKILTTEGVPILIRLWVNGPRITHWRAVHWVDRSLLAQGHTNYANTEAGIDVLRGEVIEIVDRVIFGPEVRQKEIEL